MPPRPSAPPARTRPPTCAADFVAGLQVDEPADAAGSIKFTADEAQGNAFATIQGMLAFGAPALDEIEAAGSLIPTLAVLR